METAISYTDHERAWISSDQRRMVNRITKLKEQHPEAVKIEKQPQENDGCIYASFPQEWVKIGPPRKINLTDEQRRTMSERMKAARPKE